MKWENKGHEFDDLIEVLEPRKHMIIYGITEEGVELYKRIQRITDEILFCDDRYAGQDTDLGGIGIC